MTSTSKVERDRVCVTGAAGYIGSHIVRELLERGYRVRATVRNADDSSRNKHLLEIAENANASDRFELVSANIIEEYVFDEAVKDCRYVCHVAANVSYKAKNPYKEIVEPTLGGTLNVLKSVSKSDCVEKVILTSSTAAVVDTIPSTSHIYTENDWNEKVTLDLNAYSYAKTLSERAAWKFIQELDRKCDFELISLNPCLVLGPMYAQNHANSSPAIIWNLMTKWIPAIPAININIVDVRDVAIAHAEALINPEVSGRYILSSDSAWMHEVVEVLRHSYPDNIFPRMSMPNALMHLLALFHPRLNWRSVKHTVGCSYQISNQRAKQDLGISFRDIKSSIIDTAESIL